MTRARPAGRAACKASGAKVTRTEATDMRLSTRAHGYLDYSLSALLIAAPWLLGFARGGW